MVMIPPSGYIKSKQYCWALIRNQELIELLVRKCMKHWPETFHRCCAHPCVPSHQNEWHLCAWRSLDHWKQTAVQWETLPSQIYTELQYLTSFISFQVKRSSVEPYLGSGPISNKKICKSRASTHNQGCLHGKQYFAMGHHQSVHLCPSLTILHCALYYVVYGKWALQRNSCLHAFESSYKRSGKLYNKS